MTFDYVYKTKTWRLLNKAKHISDEEIREEHVIVQKAKYDAKAFGLLYDKYFEGIFGFIYRRTDDEDVTADLVSQTFLKALQSIKKYEYRGLPFSAWLYRIASNEVNKHYRKTKTKKVFSLEETLLIDLVAQSVDTDGQEYVDIALELLGNMPTEMVEVLELRFFEEKSFKEMAYILDISESGAKMRTYRALDKLREQFNIKLNF